MTKEEKQLLLKDLCARLSYGVICQFIWTFSNETTNGEDVITKGDDIIRCIDICTKEIQANYYGEWVDLEHCKPYLRPISSLIDEECNKLFKILNIDEEDGDWLKISDINVIRLFTENGKDFYEIADAMDYLYSIHVDFRDMIEKGLALEAPEDMYKTE